MFCKTDPFRQSLEEKSIESMADVLQRIGAGLVYKGEIQLGLRWLRRAYDLLDSYKSCLSPKARHSYLVISNDIISLIMQDDIHQNIEEVRRMLAHTESKLGESPVLLRWRLKILDLASDGDSDSESYTSILQRLVLLPNMSESTFCLVLSHIQRLESERSASLEFLDGLLFRHAIPAENMTWIGKIVFMRIWMASGIAAYGDECAQLWDVVDKVYTSAQAPLWNGAAKVCHAVRLSASDRRTS